MVFEEVRGVGALVEMLKPEAFFLDFEERLC